MNAGVATTADLDLIQRIIPHRYPFLLIDKVKDIVLHESCTGIKCVTLNEPQFQGHLGSDLFGLCGGAAYSITATPTTK